MKLISFNLGDLHQSKKCYNGFIVALVAPNP